MTDVALCKCGCGRPAPLAEKTYRARGLRKGEPYDYLPGHHKVVRDPKLIEERFWARVDKTETCWLWTGAKYKFGHGRLALPDRNWALAHRFAYELVVGPIPDGLHLDHLCHTPACVNPAHLEPVTQEVNTMRGTSPAALNARKTHCKRDHEFTPENTRIYESDGRRYRSCRTCDRIRARALYWRKKSAA